MKNTVLIISIVILVLHNLNASTVNRTRVGNETIEAYKLSNYPYYSHNSPFINIFNKMHLKDYFGESETNSISFESILNIIKANEITNLKDYICDLDFLFSNILKQPTNFYRTMYSYTKTLDSSLGKSELIKCKIFSEDFNSILEKLKNIFTTLHAYDSKIQSRVLSKNLVCADEFGSNNQIYSKFYSLIKKENVLKAFETCGKYGKAFANEWSNEVKKIALFMVVATKACEYDFYKTNLVHEVLLEEIEDSVNYYTDVVLLKEFKNDQGENGLIKSVQSILENSIFGEEQTEQYYIDRLDKTYNFFKWKVNYPLPNNIEMIIAESDDFCGSYYYENLNALVSWCVLSVPNQNADEKLHQREQKELNNMFLIKSSGECPDDSFKFYLFGANSKTQKVKEHYCAYITEKFKFNDYLVVPELSETLVSFDATSKTDRNTPMGIFIGCFVDNQQHDLNYSKYTHPLMTIDSCSKYCSNKGYSYFGVQNSHECFCGNEFGKYGKAKSIAECNAKCGGDSDAYCGGFLRNSIYQAVVGKNETIVENSKIKYLGCSDSVNFEFIASLKNMTIGGCSKICSSNEYSYFAVQDGSDCYCSNEYDSNSLVNSDKCDYPCTGNYESLCGGKLVKSIYENRESNKNSHSKYIGCFSNKPLTNDTYTSSSMNIYKCGLYCLNKYYTFFGLLNGNECSCGENFNQNDEVVSIDCEVPCEDKTDKLSKCGGENAQTIYEIKNEFNQNSSLNTNEIIFSTRRNYFVYLQSNGLIKAFDDNFDLIAVNGKIEPNAESYQLKIDNSSLTMFAINGSVQNISWSYEFYESAESPILVLDNEAKLKVIKKNGNYLWDQSTCACPCRWAEANGLHTTKSYKNECFKNNILIPSNTFRCIRNRC